MSTHINAFVSNVAEKEQALVEAQSNLAEAERLFKEHPDYKAPKKDVKEPEEIKVTVKKR